jgi:hypothetical protein
LKGGAKLENKLFGGLRRAFAKEVGMVQKPYPSFLGFRLRGKEFLAYAPPDSSDPETCLEKQLKEGYKLRIKKGTKRITLFRFLLAKLVYQEEEGLHLDEFIVMMELYYDLLENKDPTFNNKYQNWLNQIQPFLLDVSGCQEFPAILERTPSTTQLYIDFLKPFIPTREAFYGLRGNRDLRNSWVLTFNAQLTPQRKFDRRVIGVGYRDKGHRKLLSLDGSPDWREVAEHFTELFRRISEGELPKEFIPAWLLSEYERESGE